MYYRILVMALSAAVLLPGCASRQAPTGATPIATPAATITAGTITAATTPPTVNRLKHKVAIARLALPGDAAPDSESLVAATAQAKSHLEKHVRQTGNFMLLEHGLLQMSLENDNLKLVNDESVGADFLVTGKLLRHELVLPGLLDGWRDNAKAGAHASVQIDIIDGHTGAVVFSRQFEGDARQPASEAAQFGPAQHAVLQAQALSNALDNATPEITSSLLQRRWRGLILSNQQGFILVNSGAGQGIRVGDRLHVLPLADTAIDRPPGAPTFLATLKVVAQAGENENELSVCELVEGTLPETLGDLSVLDAL